MERVRKASPLFLFATEVDRDRSPTSRFEAE
jgi:hypothetical protein